MANVPPERLAAVTRIVDLSERIDAWRVLTRAYPDDATVWFNLAADLGAATRVQEAATERGRDETRAAARRALDISPTLRDSMGAWMRKLLDDAAVKPDGGRIDPVDARVGQVIQGYRVGRVTSRSDVQVLYDATAPGGRAVTLRFIADLSATAAMEQLARDVGASAQLNGLAKVLDVIGDEEGVPFQVLSHLGGRTLTELYASGPLPLAHALGLLGEVAQTLGALHQRKLVHADLRADHLVLTPGQPPREPLLLGGGGVPLLVETARFLTLSDERWRWLAPEASAGWPLDARTDVYGLGLLLYFLASGRPPPRVDPGRPPEPPRLAATPAATLHAEELARKPELLDQLDAVIARACSLRPGERHHTPADLIADLPRA